CLPKWSLFKGHCYKFVKEKQPWKDAERKCRETPGSHLTSVHSAEENHFITSLVPPSFLYFWVGVQNIKTADVYVWADFTRPDYNNWETSEPDGTGYCGNVKQFDGSWHDFWCYQQHAYICKYKLQPK
ncbi:predicted protein, partial [Nematostella vectensis]